MILRVFLLSLAISFATPHAEAALSCSELFSARLPLAGSLEGNLKSAILARALEKTKISVTEDQKYINKVLEKWDLNESSPVKVERIAQKIVIKSDTKTTFLKWLKSLFYKNDALKEAIRVRAETLVLKNEMLDQLILRGYDHENSKLDKLREFREKNDNAIKVAQMVVLDSLSIHYLGFPVYMPLFNFTKTMDLTPSEVDLVRRVGFNEAYKTILKNHRIKAVSHSIFDHMPQIFILSIASYMTYNYLDVKSVETRYEITDDNVIPQSNPIYNAWKVQREAKLNRKVDLRNAQDLKDWQNTVHQIYRAWADEFNEKQGRYPDLSNPQDRRAWEEFLSEIQS